MRRHSLKAAVFLVGMGLLASSPWAPAQDKLKAARDLKGPPPPVPQVAPDLPPLPEPMDPPVAPPPRAPAPGSFPAPVSVDVQPVAPAPRPAPEPYSNFASIPRGNERPVGRPPAFRLLVPPQRPDAPPSHPAPAEHPIEIPVVTAAQGPALIVEKKGPASVPLGQPLLYEIVVRNVGSAAAQQVRVADELPPGTRVLGADPVASVTAQGDRLGWVIESLAPGAERRFRVQAQPAAAGDWTGSASASLVMSVSSSLHSQVAPAPLTMAANAATPSRLTITLTGPSTVAVGQNAVFQIRVTNNGTQPLTGLVLKDRVPAGLQHPAGPELEADLGALEPGKTRNITLTTKAIQPGRFINDALVATSDGQQAEARAAIQILEAGRPGR